MAKPDEKYRQQQSVRFIDALRITFHGATFLVAATTCVRGGQRMKLVVIGPGCVVERLDEHGNVKSAANPILVS